MTAGITRVIVAGQSNPQPYCPDTRVVVDAKYSPLANVPAVSGFRGSFNSDTRIKIKPWQPYGQVLSYPMTYTPLTSSRLWGGASQVLAWRLANQLGHTLSITSWAEGSTGLATDWLPAGVGNRCYRELVNVWNIGNASPYAPTLATAARTVLLWWQGETDAMDSTNSAAYQANWNTFIAQLRTDLGIANLKVLLVKLNAASSTTFKANVRSAQVAIQGADSSRITLFDTDAYALSGDGLHYISTVAETIGLAIATAIDGMV